ncbi:MAG: metal-dependent transcriptional regulator [Gemmatimonadaceae bacterium]|nr:metal-dependent transcriptional regulator [Gemmatimonadaceae bacterium]
MKAPRRGGARGEGQAKSAPVLTRQAEDYLKAIYEIERDGEPAGTTAIAARLGIASASVSGMIRRLARQGLMTVERYRGVQLTPAGRRLALQMIRRHRVLESYLVTRLGFGWDSVHDEAERLEHAASPALIEAMAAALGDPDEDPHGAPIPRADGTVDDSRLRTLDDLAVGTAARVARMSDRDPALLRYLAELGIKPGASLRLVDRAPFEGPLTVAVGRARHVIGAAVARKVFVR